MSTTVELHEILSELKQGNSVMVDGPARKPLAELRFDRGKWVRLDLSCSSDTCAHNSHDQYIATAIDRHEALVMIKRIVADRLNYSARRAAEIAWLDRAIAELVRA